MKSVLVAAFLVLIADAILAADPIVKVLDIAGESPAAVGKILGPPKKREMVQYGGKKWPRIHYAKGIEVLFVSGKADIIDVKLPDLEKKKPEEVLALVGLDPGTPPTWQKSEYGLMRWEGIQGLAEVHLLREGALSGQPVTSQEIKVWVTPLK